MRTSEKTLSALERLKNPAAIRLNLALPKPRAPAWIVAMRNINRILTGVAALLVLAWLSVEFATWTYKYKAKELERSLGGIPGLSQARRICGEIRFLQEHLSAVSPVLSQRTSLSMQTADLTRALPWGTWLTSLDASVSPATSGGSSAWSLSGSADDHETLIKAIRILEALPWMEKVKLNESHREPLPGAPPIAPSAGGKAEPPYCVTFSISCQGKPR